MEGQLESDSCISPPKVIFSRKNRVVETEVCENQGGFPVQKIIGFYSGKEKAKYYRVQWVPTWIHEDGLINCDDLIKEFFVEQNIIKDGHGEPQKIKSEKSPSEKKSQGCKSKCHEFASKEKFCCYQKKHTGFNKYGGSKKKYRRCKKKLCRQDELCGCELGEKSSGSESLSLQTNIKSENLNKQFGDTETYSDTQQFECPSSNNPEFGNSTTKLRMNNLIGPGLDINDLLGRNLSRPSSDTTKALILTLEKLLADDSDDDDDDDATISSTNVKRKYQTNKDPVHKEYSLRSTNENGLLQSLTERMGEKENSMHWTNGHRDGNRKETELTSKSMIQNTGQKPTQDLLNNDNYSQRKQGCSYQSTPQKQGSSMEGNQQVFIMRQGDHDVSSHKTSIQKPSNICGRNLAARASLHPDSSNDQWGLCGMIQSNRNATLNENPDEIDAAIPTGTNSFSSTHQKKILPMKRKYRTAKGNEYSSGEEEWALRIGDKLPDGIKDWCGLKTKKERLENVRSSTGKKKIPTLNDHAFSEQQIRLQVDDPATEKALLDVQIRVSDDKSQPLVENLDSSSGIDEYLDSSDDEMDSCDDLLDSTFSYDEDMDESYYHEDLDTVPNCPNDKIASTVDSSKEPVNAISHMNSSEIMDVVVKHPTITSSDDVDLLQWCKYLPKDTDSQVANKNPSNTGLTEESSKFEHQESRSIGDDIIDRANSCDEVMVDILNILDRLGPNDEIEQLAKDPEKEISYNSEPKEIPLPALSSELISKEFECIDVTVKETVSAECISSPFDSSEKVNEYFMSSTKEAAKQVQISDRIVHPDSSENALNDVEDKISERTTKGIYEKVEERTYLKNHSCSSEDSSKQPKYSHNGETKICEGMSVLSNSIENIDESSLSSDVTLYDPTKQLENVSVNLNPVEDMTSPHIGLEEVIVESASTELEAFSESYDGMKEQCIPQQDIAAETNYSLGEVPADLIKCPTDISNHINHQEDFIHLPNDILSGAMVSDQSTSLENVDNSQERSVDRIEQSDFTDSSVTNITGLCDERGDLSENSNLIVEGGNFSQKSIDGHGGQTENIVSSDSSEEIPNFENTSVDKSVQEDLHYQMECEKKVHVTGIEMASNRGNSDKHLDSQADIVKNPHEQFCEHVDQLQSFDDKKTGNVITNLALSKTEILSIANKINPTSSTQFKQQHDDTILFDFDKEMSIEEKISTPAKSVRRRLGGMRASFHKRYKTISSMKNRSACNGNKVVSGGGTSWSNKLFNDTLPGVCVEVMNDLLSCVCDKENMSTKSSSSPSIFCNPLKHRQDKGLNLPNEMVNDGVPISNHSEIIPPYACSQELSNSLSSYNWKPHLLQEGKLEKQANVLEEKSYSKDTVIGHTVGSSFNSDKQEITTNVKLSEHLETHEMKGDRRRWLCVVCGGNFCGKAYVKKHLKRVHHLPDDVISGYAEYAEQYDSLSNPGSKTVSNELDSSPNSQLYSICHSVLRDIVDRVCRKGKSICNFSSPMCDEKDIVDSLFKLEDDNSNVSLPRVQGKSVSETPTYIGDTTAANYLSNNIELIKEYLKTYLMEDNNRKWLCIVCGSALSQKYNMKRHLKKKHQIPEHLVSGYLEVAAKYYPISETSVENQINISATNSSSVEDYAGISRPFTKDSILDKKSSNCVEDPKSQDFTWNENFNSSSNINIEPKKEIIVTEDVLEFSDNNHSEVDYDKLYECDICGKTFRSKFFLHRHRFNHNAKTARPSELQQKFNPNRMRWRSHCLRQRGVFEFV